MKTFALALGAGGARGLAHIAVIEALDEMGVKPVAIAGSSIGAVIGAGYAAGMSGHAMRHHVIALAHNRAEVMRRLMAARAGTLADFLAAHSRPRWWTPRSSARSFWPSGAGDFAALKIPLTVMATDLHAARPLSQGRAQARGRGLDRAAGPGAAGGDRRARADRRRRHQPAAVRQLARPGRRRRRGRCVRPADRRARRRADPWESLFATISVMSHTIVSHKLERRARPRAAAEHRHLPHARFLPGERHPARGRADQGRREREAGRPALKLTHRRA